HADLRVVRDVADEGRDKPGQLTTGPGRCGHRLAPLLLARRAVPGRTAAPAARLLPRAGPDAARRTAAGRRARGTRRGGGQLVRGRLGPFDLVGEADLVLFVLGELSGRQSGARIAGPAAARHLGLRRGLL